MILCEFEYCIYNKETVCQLVSELEIDRRGMCANCVIVKLPGDCVEREKERQLGRTRKR